MQLTKHTDNSLRVLMYLALKPKQLSTVSEISTNFNMSRNHLMKIVNRLTSLGYVNSTQGRHGGLRLAVDASEISVGMVVRDMESTLNVIDCESPVCPIISACKLKNVADRATHAFLAVLDESTIADLTRQRRTLLSLIG